MRRPALAVLIVLVAASACSNQSKTDDHSTSGVTRSVATRADARTMLLAAVRTALRDHHKLSIQVLWTNVVPTQPAAIGGPALANLRQSALARRHRGIRIRLISEHFRILRIDIDPSYSRATAIVLDPQRVRPYGRSGRPLGRQITINERARIALRRVGHRPQFVVWNVVALR